jgi:hypothetical protein
MRINLLLMPGLVESREMDVDSGQLSFGQADLIHGVVARVSIDGSDNVPVSVYAHEAEVFFQVGSNRWPIRQTGLKFAHRRLWYSFGLLNEFVARDSAGDIVFSNRYVDRYWFKGRNWFDFTYDELDRELDDIFLWIANTCNDKKWREQFAIDWTRGMPIPAQSQVTA